MSRIQPVVQITRIVDSNVIQRVESCVAMPISHLTRSKIEDFYGNVQWKFDESLRTTLWEAKMYEKETYSFAYNFRLSIEETVCLLTGTRSISLSSTRM